MTEVRRLQKKLVSLITDVVNKELVNRKVVVSPLIAPLTKEGKIVSFETEIFPGESILVNVLLSPYSISTGSCIAFTSNIHIEAQVEFEFDEDKRARRLLVLLHSFESQETVVPEATPINVNVYLIGDIAVM